MASKANNLMWFSERAFRELGFIPSGPEEDFTQGASEQQTIRISFAPRDSDELGYLYAYDASTEKYAVLAPQTTRTAATKAYDTVTLGVRWLDDCLELAGRLDPDTTLTLEHTRAIWEHCLEREADLRRRYERLGLDAPHRFATAHAMLLARAARSASEDLLITGLTRERETRGEPAIVRYRILGRDDWRGRAVGVSVSHAAQCMDTTRKTLREFGYTAQATSLMHGHLKVSALRVPELAHLAQPATHDTQLVVGL